MQKRAQRWSLSIALVVVLVAAGFAGACGSSDDNGFGGDAGNTDGTVFDGPLFGGDGMLFGEGSTGQLAITPPNKVIDVTTGQPIPSVTFVATLNGATVPASFSIDRGEIGSIGAGTGVFTPGGMLGGKANVTAAYQGKTASTTITVRLHLQQNGTPQGVDAGGGLGGNGGVGGEGTGGQVGGAGQGVLNGNPTQDPGLGWLYPYDQTVWPRGILAPLLQWTSGTNGNYDSVYIHITEAAFEYQGYFTKTATPFIHHPIPEDAWHALAYSNAGEDVKVTLTFASGNTAYGPITETWKIAQGTLKGTVYYNSYGTALATNYCDATTWGPAQICFGGATLAVRGGSTDPVLIAGTNSPAGDQTGCRVCHSVAADGSQLITQHGDAYQQSSAYDLKNMNMEMVIGANDSQMAFPALAPDGTFLFSNTAPIPGVNNAQPSALFSVPAGTPIASTGLPAGFQAGTPAFSPDGKHVAYNDYTADKMSLGAMDFAQASNTFSNQVTLHTPMAGQRDLFPAFLPTNDAVVFQLEVANDGEFGATRNGSRGELWWIDLKTKTAARLDKLNGQGYLPNGPNNHTMDTTLDYEPTVNPVPSGGYAWVVFTSRRMYGNVATIDAFSSDPRNADLSGGDPNKTTTKKLWVAAIDLNAPAGSDPSHPAFYLPGQELLAGNSRGYWVIDPCQKDGTSCDSGDECCGGYCSPAGDGGALVCSSQRPMCSQEFDKCMVTSDCCGAAQGIQCINGRCAQPVPR
jgi:hypothetical protein